jgi:capsular exopolysaccharide synthesis family protein
LSLEQIQSIRADIEPKDRLVFHGDPRNPGVDRFRFLRMRLKQGWPAARPRSLLITSPLPHDGKSTIAINLASALCEQGKYKVLLVEADLHHLCLRQQLRLPYWPGLAECLCTALNPFDAMRRIEPLQWYLLPGGNPIENPTDVLHTSALPGIMQTIVPFFDWVIVDSPPVLPVTDALALAQHVGGTLLVVRAGQTPDEAVEQSITALNQNLIGVVLNGAEKLNHRYSHYGYYRPPSDSGTDHPTQRQ